MRQGAPHPRLEGAAALPGVSGFFVEVAVAELWIIAVSIEQGVSPVGLVQLSVGDRLGEPAVVDLVSDLQHPAREDHRDALDGQLPHEREDPFPEPRPELLGRLAWER